MNFQPLYTTARVMRAIFQIASTVMMMIYLIQRNDDRKRIRHRRGARYYEDE